MPTATHPDYPAVFAIWGRDRRDEAARFADLVEFLKKNDVIADYSQVALLLHSVREDHSGPYLAALEAQGHPRLLPPRPRLLRDPGGPRPRRAASRCSSAGTATGAARSAGAVAELAAYVDDAIVQLGRRFGAPHPLAAGAAALDRRDRRPAGRRSARPAPRRLLLPPARARAVQERGHATRTPPATSRSSRSS